MKNLAKIVHKIVRRFHCLFLSIAIAVPAAMAAGVSPALAARDIVIIVDGSGSISDADFAIQKQGINAALSDDKVVPRDGSIALAVVQFSLVGTIATRVEVSYTIVDEEQDITSIKAQVAAISQIGALTNPGDGINTATAILNANARTGATQEYCLSTDGLPNSGADVGSALATAINSAFGLEAFGVLAIEDPPIFFKDDFEAFYGPLVVGDRKVIVVRNATEFAINFGANCVAPELELIGLEVVQIIQDLENGVSPLVQDRPAIVRAYIQPKGTQPAIAAVRLEGERNGVPLPGSPLAMEGGSIEVAPDVLARRGQLDASVNFELPPEWRSGQVTLTVEPVGGALDCLEAAGPTPSDCSVTVNFTGDASIGITLLKLDFTDVDPSFGPPSDADMMETKERLKQILPFRNFSFAVDELRPGTLIDFSIHGSIATYALVTDGRLTPFSDHVYQGARLILEGGEYSRFTNTSTFRFLNTSGSGRYSSAHEVGHHRGIKHPGLNGVGQCGEDDVEPFPFFGNVGGSTVALIGPLDEGPDKQVFGHRNRTKQVIAPSEHFALMSYCGNTVVGKPFNWLSKPNLPRFVSGTSPIAPLQQVAQASREVLIIRGGFNFDTGEATFLPLITVETSAETPLPLPGDFLLRMEDASGNVLTEIPLGIERTAIDPLDTTSPTASVNGPFFVVIDANPAIHRIALLLNGNEVGSVTTSQNAPTIQLLSPNGGETLDGETVMVQWVANDADGDTLTVTVLFSTDGGNTFRPISTTESAVGTEVRVSTLPKTDQGLVRVIASDGFLSSSDDSDGFFSIPNHAPLVNIISPINQETFVGVENVFFRASTLDVDEVGIELLGEHIAWTSSLDGFLGTGEELVVNANDLTEGVHVIEVEATDGDGGVATDQVAIRITRLPLPGGTIAIIDVKPGNADNVINLGSDGVIPVAILSSSVANGDPVDFDATQVDPPTLSLQGATARERGNSGTFGSTIDVNGDGLLDFKVNFETAELQLSPSDTMLVLDGQTLDGIPFMGTDIVTVVPAN